MSTIGPFPGDVKPVRVGLYPVRHAKVSNGKWEWAWWTGDDWRMQHWLKMRALRTATTAAYQDKQWKGRNHA